MLNGKQNFVTTLFIFYRLLLCDREESRPGESCFRCCWKPMPQCIVKASAISTDNLAKAMVYKATYPSEKVEIIENKQLYDLI